VRCAARDVVNDSVRFGRIAGVDIGLHWSVLVIGGLLAAGLARGRLPSAAPGYSSVEYVVAAGVAALVFLGCVLAHELGHAVVARREGIGVDGVTLWLLGGVTRMTSEAATPRAEVAISGAGPLTNLGLGVVMVDVALALRAGAVSPLLAAVFGWLGVVNIVLAVFNSLPGAPLDGGHLLYAFVWRRHGDRLRATRAASRAGSAIGTVLIVLGFVEIARGTALERGIWLALLGWFLCTGARAEAHDAVAESRSGTNRRRHGAQTLGGLLRPRPSPLRALPPTRASIHTGCRAHRDRRRGMN
jgi:Zn-dependent protease